jgi:hypothetical protein
MADAGTGTRDERTPRLLPMSRATVVGVRLHRMKQDVPRATPKDGLSGNNNNCPSADLFEIESDDPDGVCLPANVPFCRFEATGRSKATQRRRVAGLGSEAAQLDRITIACRNTIKPRLILRQSTTMVAAMCH